VLLVVYPGRGEVAALGSHLLNDGFVDEEVVFATIASAVATFLLFGEQVVAFEKTVGRFCNDGGQDLVHCWQTSVGPVVFRIL